MTETAQTVKTVSRADAEKAELTRSESAYEDADLASIGSFADAIELLQASGVVPESFADSYGTGFTVLDTKDKRRLVGVDFVALEWAFNTGENGEFVSAAIVTTTGEKLILNDGSTGICKQFRTVTATRLARGESHDKAYKGLAVKGGLRESEYPTYQPDKDSAPRPLTREELRDTPEIANGKGVTYYLAN